MNIFLFGMWNISVETLHVENMAKCMVNVAKYASNLAMCAGVCVHVCVLNVVKKCDVSSIKCVTHDCDTKIVEILVNRLFNRQYKLTCFCQLPIQILLSKDWQATFAMKSLLSVSTASIRTVLPPKLGICLVSSKCVFISSSS